MGGIQLPITNEEAEVLAKFESTETINKQDLNEREQILVNSLVNKNVIVRRHTNGQINYFRQKHS
jgi:hypothetical protein